MKNRVIVSWSLASWTLSGLNCAGLLALLVFGAAPAVAQQQPVPLKPQYKPVEEPGAFESIGRFFGDGAATFREHLSRARERADDLGERAAATGRGAADAVSRLPNTRMVQGREICPAAANGAPDCHTAAVRLCQERGFLTGRSMDFTSAEICPPRAWSAAGWVEAECTTRTFISRAMCQ